MLKVDLGLLERHGRLSIEDRIDPEDPLWREVRGRPDGPLEVRVVVDRAAGDVLVRGSVSGEVKSECRRCLKEVTVETEEELVLLFRPGLSAVDAEADEIYPMGSRDRELDLAPAVREHVILALSQDPLCAEACRGLCPKCGTNLNQSSCECVTAVDARWSALRGPAG